MNILIKTPEFYQNTIYTDFQKLYVRSYTFLNLHDFFLTLSCLTPK